MDFDEYDYLEKTVENPDILKVANGDGERLSDREERGYRRGSKRRDDEDSHGQDYVRKRNRAEEEERDRGDKDRSLRNSGRRSPSQHVSRDRDRERDREKVRFDRERGDREREKGDRDRDRERTEKDPRERDRASRERERGRASREREKEKERDRASRERERERASRERERERERIRGDKEKERDREKDRGEREKSRGKSRDSDRHRDKEGDRERDKEREAHKDREKESHRDRDHERAHARSRERKERTEEPAPAEPEADPERDQRTVFAYQISLKADERDVYEFFSRAGKVRDVRLIMDRNSRRSKGVGYIEFYDAMSVPIAIAMSGQLLLGQPVMVKPSEAEKNLVQSTTAGGGGAGGYTGPYSGGARRLYVGNLHFNITEDQLRQVFEPFGPVELVQLPTDPETGQCKGFGFVQYQKLEDARAAQQALNGVLELVGRPIKVSAVTDQYGMQDMGVTPGDLDDDEGGGLALNARSRALLMQKLDRSGTATGAIGAVSPNPIAAPSLGVLGATVPGVIPAAAPLLPTSLIGQALPGIALGGMPNPGVAAAGIPPSPEPIGAPSDCLLLKNMFDPQTETEPDFDLDIKDDVQEECSKFGVVKHIYVEKNSAGHVYLRFDGVTAAINAQRALHGRWFAGKMITATYMTALAYQTKFPESR